MRILYLAQRVPFPPDRGDKIISFNTIRHLAAKHRISVFCLADGGRDLENVGGVEDYAEKVVAVPLRRRYGRLRGLASLARGQSLTAGFFREPELQHKLDEHLRTVGADLILVFSSGMAPYVRAYAEVPRMIQFGDLDSQKWDQFAGTSRWPMSLIYRAEARQLLRVERGIAESFCHSILCTPEELKDFERLIGTANVSCISNGVDLERFSPGSETEDARALIFTGVMDYLPNIDAVGWFSREILPRVQAQIPEATFVICGSRPTAEVRRLADLPGVTVTGRVPEVVPYLRRSAIAVVPMRLGRGIQNKLLEAMAVGLPCVATTLGFEGADAEPGHDLVIADDAQAFSEAIVGLLNDPERRRTLGQNARETVQQRYRWETKLARLDELIEIHAGSGYRSSSERQQRVPPIPGARPRAI